MKFLSVFCVIFCFDTGFTMPNLNNAQVEKPISLNNNYDEINNTDLNNSYNTNGNVLRVIKNPPDMQKGSKEIFPDSIDTTVGQLEIEHIQIPTDTILTRTALPNSERGKKRNLLSQGLQNLSYQPNKEEQSITSGQNFPKGEIQKNISPDNYENSYLNTERNIRNQYFNQPNIKIQPSKPEETRLDLQGVSLEKIKSLISQSSTENLSDQKIPTMTDSNLNKDSYNSLRYIINKAQKLQNIHSSAKKLKRFMIVHPDGTVEHHDNLDIVASRYPNYVAVKSSDLSKYVINEPTPSTRLINQKPEGQLSPINPTNIKDNTVILNDNPTETRALNSENNVLNIASYAKNLATISLETTLKPNIEESITEINTADDKSVESAETKEINRDNKITFSGWMPLDARKDETNNSNTQSILPSSSLEDIDHSGLWFHDRNFWDKLKNESHNVFYFLYVPTTPQIKKETKTTIYPNGTTVEEVLEIVDGKDGIPVAIKTTKVKLSENNCDPNKKQIL